MIRVNLYVSVVVHNTFLISFQYFFVIFQFVFLFKFCFLQITNTEKIVFHKKFLVFLFSKLLFTFVFFLVVVQIHSLSVVFYRARKRCLGFAQPQRSDVPGNDARNFCLKLFVRSISDLGIFLPAVVLISLLFLLLLCVINTTYIQ